MNVQIGDVVKVGRQNFVVAAMDGFSDDKPHLKAEMESQNVVALLALQRLKGAAVRFARLYANGAIA